MCGCGACGIRAKPKLTEHGFLAVYGLIERLREIDYTSSEANMTAFEYNKLLEELTTLNTGFATVGMMEDLDPRKADWNAKTTKAWFSMLGQAYMSDAKAATLR